MEPGIEPPGRHRYAHPAIALGQAHLADTGAALVDQAGHRLNRGDGHRHDRGVELHPAGAPLEDGIAEGEDAAVGGDQVITIASGCDGHADHGPVEALAPLAAPEDRVAEGEDPAVARHEEVAGGQVGPPGPHHAAGHPLPGVSGGPRHGIGAAEPELVGVVRVVLARDVGEVVGAGVDNDRRPVTPQQLGEVEPVGSEEGPGRPVGPGEERGQIAGVTGVRSDAAAQVPTGRDERVGRVARIAEAGGVDLEAVEAGREPRHAHLDAGEVTVGTDGGHAQDLAVSAAQEGVDHGRFGLLGEEWSAPGRGQRRPDQHRRQRPPSGHRAHGVSLLMPSARG